MKGMCRSTCVVMVSGLLVAGSVYGQVPPQKAPSLAQKAFSHSGLKADDLQISVHQLPEAAATKSVVTLQRLGAGLDTARIDQRTGRFITLTPTVALLPGDGVGNSLRWDDLGKAAAPASEIGLEKAAWNAFHGFLDGYSAELGLDMGELSADYRIATHNDGRLIQINAPRLIDGIPVRGSHVSAVISHGNLIMMGMHKWADRPSLTKAATIGRDRAREATAKHLDGLTVEREWAKPELGSGSTDANVPISLGVPATTISRGGLGGAAHSLEEWWSDHQVVTGTHKALLLLLASAGLSD